MIHHTHLVGSSLRIATHTIYTCLLVCDGITSNASFPCQRRSVQADEDPSKSHTAPHDTRCEPDTPTTAVFIISLPILAHTRQLNKFEFEHLAGLLVAHGCFQQKEPIVSRKKTAQTH